MFKDDDSTLKFFVTSGAVLATGVIIGFFLLIIKVILWLNPQIVIWGIEMSRL